MSAFSYCRHRLLLDGSVSSRACEEADFQCTGQCRPKSAVDVVRELALPARCGRWAKGKAVVQRWRPPARSIRRAAAACCCVSAWADLLNRMRDLYLWFTRGHNIYDVIKAKHCPMLERARVICRGKRHLRKIVQIDGLRVLDEKMSCAN